MNFFSCRKNIKKIKHYRVHKTKTVVHIYIDKLDTEYSPRRALNVISSTKGKKEACKPNRNNMSCLS